MSVLQWLHDTRKAGRTGFAALLDPDHPFPESFIDHCVQSKVDLFFVGGSLLTGGSPADLIGRIKLRSRIPVVIFPGTTHQIEPSADAFLLLSLISGRNPDLLIGKHVESAMALRASRLEIIPTGYLLIDGGRPTTASYISNTQPLPANKPEIAAVTAMAGQMLGLKAMFLDAGSGADNPVAPELIARVREEIDVPLIVGGGITSADKAFDAASAGADLVVVGNALEDEPALLPQMVAAAHAAASPSKVKP